MLCAEFGWHWLSGFGEEDFLNFVNLFSLLLNYLPLEKSGPFIWTNLNSFHPRMLCAKFGWNWPSGSWEEVKNRKSLQTDWRTDRKTDAEWKATRNVHLRFEFRWAKKDGKLLQYTFNVKTFLPTNCRKLHNGYGEEVENVRNLQTDRMTSKQQMVKNTPFSQFSWAEN